MAANTDLLGKTTWPRCVRLTLPSTANNLREVQIPKLTKTVTVQFITNDGKIAFDGTDDTAIGTDYVSVAADQLMEIQFSTLGMTRHRNSDPSIYATSATGSTVLVVTCEGPIDGVI